MSTSTQEAGSMAISEQVEEMERGELEDLAVNLYKDLEQRLDEVEDLARDNRETAEQNKEELDSVQTQVEMVKEDAWTLEDVVYGEHHDGASATVVASECGGILNRVDDLERGEVTVSDVIDAGATECELQISRWRADVEDAGHPDDVSGLTKNQARSTELWRYFPKLSEDFHGDKRLTRSDATKIFRSLSDYDIPTDRNTVNRCMRFMARGTGSTDDEENDDHLVTFEPGDEGSQSVLVADQDEWETFAAKVAGVDTPDRDNDEIDLTANPDANSGGEDAGKADDATNNVVEDSAVMTDAEPVTAAADDPVADDHGIEDDSPPAQEL